MKTAEEYLDNKISEIYDMAFPDGYKMPKGLWYNGALKAMKAYAKAAIEEDRKDAAEKTIKYLVSQGIYGFLPKTRSSIIDRPLPELK